MATYLLEVSVDSSPWCLLLLMASIIVVSLWLGGVREFELCMLLLLFGVLVA